MADLESKMYKCEIFPLHCFSMGILEIAKTYVNMLWGRGYTVLTDAFYSVSKSIQNIILHFLLPRTRGTRI